MFDDDDCTCVRCGAEDAPIFLCDAGWWCESCYRVVAEIPEDLLSDDLHDGINDGRQAENISLLKSKIFSENFDPMDLEGVK